MMDKLHDSLLEEILLLLPVSSLIQSKLVSKSWYALISDQNFVYRHLLRARSPCNNAENSLLLVNRRDRTTFNYMASWLSYENLQVFREEPINRLHSWSQYLKVYIAGSCNGIVCLHDNADSNIVLWNPATQEKKLIPSSNKFRSIFNGIGFGFDARTRDYKIIRLFKFFTRDRKRFYYIGEVYSLSTNSWRRINSQYRCEVRDCCRGMRTDQNGIGSWSAKGDDWEGILSFDISNEVFFSTPQPEDVRENNEGIARLDFLLLKESISMVVSLQVSFQDFLDIWVLHEYGNQESWTKLLTVGPLEEYLRPVLFCSNDALFIEIFFGRLALYKPSTEQITDVHIEGIINTLQVISYMESLVSLKQRI